MPDAQLQDVIAHAVEVALLKQTVERNERAITDLTVAVQMLSQQVGAMGNTLAEARGGWKMLLLLSGFAAAVASAITWFFAHMKV